MATVDKNFKVKHGLVVEGTTATVNGEDIITTGSTSDSLPEGSTNQYFTNARAENAMIDPLTLGTQTNISVTYNDGTGAYDFVAENGIADSTTDDLTEGTTNKYFTDERAQDAVGNNVGQGLTYDDAAGAVKANINSYAGAIGTHSSGWLEVKVDDSTIWTGGSANQLMVKTGEGSPVASKTYVGDNITTHAEDTSTHGVTGDIVGTTDTQTLTGKTIGDTLNFNTGGGVVGGISENSANFRVASTTYDLQLHAGNDVVITTNNGDIVLNPDSGAYIGSATAGNDILTLNNLKGYIGDNTVDGSTGNTVTDRINTAVSNLVDGAPALLDTLNELAAAIADNPNYATDVANLVAGKQDIVTGVSDTEIGYLANVTSDIQEQLDGKLTSGSAGIGNLFDVADGASMIAGNGDVLTWDGANGWTASGVASQVTLPTNTSIGNVSSTEIGYLNGVTSNVQDQIDDKASTTYVDTNFVNVADLPGQLGDYVPLTQKGAVDGVATLDGSGQVPADQLGNVPAALITSVENGPLSVTDGELAIADKPEFKAVSVGESYVGNQAGNLYQAASLMGSGKQALSGQVSDVFFLDTWAVGNAAEFFVKLWASNGDVQISKFLVATDGVNVAVTEYGIVTTNNYLCDVDFVLDGQQYIKVSVEPSQNVYVNIYATALGVAIPN